MELMIIFLLMLIIPVYASIKVNLSYKKYVKIDNEKISDTAFIVKPPAEPVVLQAGKRKYMRLK